MLRKLLKYDLKSVFKIWWIMSISILSISVVGGLAFRNILINTDNYNYFPTWEFLAIVLTVLSFAAFITVTYILVYVRYYKNFFSDEGYLTFTLPVTRAKLLLSKLLNAMNWEFACMIVMGAGLVIILALIPCDETYSSMLTFIISEAKNLISEAFNEIGIWFPVYILLICIAIVFISAANQLFIYLCITIAAVIAKKHKVLAAVGIVYGTNIVLSFIFQIFSIGWLFIADAAATAFPSLPEMNEPESYIFVFCLLLLVCVIAALVAVTMGFITLSNLERKLNLA